MDGVPFDLQTDNDPWRFVFNDGHGNDDKEEHNGGWGRCRHTFAYAHT